MVRQRLQRLRGDLPDEPGDRMFQRQVRLARIDLARDRAAILAEMEEIALINEGLDETDSTLRRFNAAIARHNLTSDPKFATLRQAIESADRRRVLDALAGIAEASGLERIGGDPGRGPEQLVAFKVGEHRPVTPGLPRPGQKMLVGKPGYRARIGDETVQLEPADVYPATVEEIRRYSR